MAENFSSITTAFEEDVVTAELDFCEFSEGVGVAPPRDALAADIDAWVASMPSDLI